MFTTGYGMYSIAIQEWGYKGMVSETADILLMLSYEYVGLIMSDWTGVYSTAESIKAGLDLEMP